nr:unnamed protein product [Spirometra erinaceieuropaei]
MAYGRSVTTVKRLSASDLLYSTWGAERRAEARARPRYPPASSPASGLLDCVLTPGPGHTVDFIDNDGRIIVYPRLDLTHQSAVPACRPSELGLGTGRARAGA